MSTSIKRFCAGLLGAGFLFLGCGGGGQPANTPKNDPLPPPEQPPVGSEPVGPTKDAANVSMADHEKDFVEGCQKAPELQGQGAEYCTCAGKMFSSTFTQQELNQAGGPSKKRLIEFQQKAISGCADKMPEGVLKTAFMKGCTLGRDGFTPFCECFWPDLRKQFTPAEMAMESKQMSPKFQSAMKTLTKKCSAKLPEAVMKKAFLDGCTEKGPETQKFCECAWKQIRTSMQPADLAVIGATETPEFKAAEEKLHKACDSLMPKK